MPDTPDDAWWASQGQQVAIDAILGLLGKIGAEQRREVFGAIREEYCVRCGGEVGISGVCHCENDD